MRVTLPFSCLSFMHATSICMLYTLHFFSFPQSSLWFRHCDAEFPEALFVLDSSTTMRCYTNVSSVYCHNLFDRSALFSPCIFLLFHNIIKSRPFFFIPPLQNIDVVCMPKPGDFEFHAAASASFTAEGIDRDHTCYVTGWGRRTECKVYGHFTYPCETFTAANFRCLVYGVS